jgi:hypothetical protein
MPDISPVEISRGITPLSPEQLKTDASLLKTYLRNKFPSWLEWKNPHLRGDGTKEFNRPPGLEGEGSWEVLEHPQYVKCNLLNPNGKWQLLIQTANQYPHDRDIISIQRWTKEGKPEANGSPAKNSKAALDLTMEFIKEINGGRIPSVGLILTLKSSKIPLFI